MINNRKRLWYRFILILAMLALLVTFVGCGANSSVAPSVAPQYDEAIDPGGIIAESGQYPGEYPAEPDRDKSDYVNDQKIIYNGRISIDVNDIEEATTAIEQTVKNAGGFLLNSTKTENDQRFYVSYEFKVPVTDIHSLMEEIESLELGVVKYNNIDGRDVTEEYQDINSRLKAKRIYEERLLELFAQADKTEDLLRIANDLSYVQEEIESLEGRQKYLAYHADNSTLAVELYQYKNRVAPAASSWTKAIEGLKITIQKIGTGLVSFLIWFVSYLPIIIIVGLVATATWFLVRLKLKKRRKGFKDVEQELLNSNDSK